MCFGGGSPPDNMDAGTPSDAGVPVAGCPPQNGHIRVTVKYRYGSDNPLLDQAEVEVSGSGGGGGTQTTGASGEVTFRDLEPGSYTVRVTRNGTTDGSTNASVTSDNTTQVEVVVIPMGTLRGRVLDNSNGNAISGAAVTIVGQSGRNATTNAQGRFEFTNLQSGSYRIQASKAGYGNNTVNVDARFRPGGTMDTEIRLRRITVAIKAQDGTADPCRIVPSGGTTQLKAIPTPATAGTYRWTTTSAKITLSNANTQTVTVTGGNQVSSARDAERIQVVFTPNGAAALSPVTANLTVVKVVFSQAAGQNYGYDNMDNGAGVDHHVSVKKNANTTVRVTVQGGVTGADLQFTSDNTSIAQPSAPAGAGAAFDLTINGGGRNKAETSIRARCKCTDNTIIGTIKANVYNEKATSATVAKIHDSTVASTALSRPNFNVGSAETAIKGWYKAAVATIDLTDNHASGGSTNVRYDLNGNGKLDLEPGGTSPEEAAIRAAFNPSGQKIVIVKDLSWIFYLRTAASIGDPSISLKTQYSSYMQFILAGDSYDLGVGANREGISVASKSGTTITLSSPLTKAHTTSEGLIYPLSGLSGNPIYVAEQGKTEAKERETMGHENAHSQISWLDLNDSDNLMHYSIGRSDTNIRFKPQPKRYGTGNENQWEKVTR